MFDDTCKITHLPWMKIRPHVRFSVILRIEQRGGSNVFNSKIIDLVIGLVMAYFAYDRLAAGSTGMGIFFIVLAALNLLAFFLKLKTDKDVQEKQL